MSHAPPPYWGLRDYGIKPVIWDGDKNCEHDFDSIQRYNPTRGKRDGKGIYKDPKWKAKGSLKKEVKSNFCLKCGAWSGSLGLEPTFDLYIKHLCDIFDEVKRVLREDGTCWVNIGDTYAGGGGWTGVPDDWKSVSTGSKQKRFDHDKKDTGIPAKSLCDIPYRFSIEMTNRGWIKRNTIIWYKKNCMPSSANDRFTIDFEYLFFFTKNNKAIFWTNEKTLKCVSKQPLGTKGIEGKDWEWRKCPRCQGEGNIKDKICPKCKGLKKVKYSFWSGHDYWFEQQFEKSIDPESYTGRRKRNAGNMVKYDKKNYLMAGSIQKDGTLRYGQKYPNRNKRAVWTIPTQPFPEAHFAVYPEELIEIPIKAGCPGFICKKCGKARVKIYKTIGKQITKSMKVAGCNKEGQYSGTEKKDYKSALAQRPSETKKRILESMSQVKNSYYTDCGCNAGWESGITLDPFMGAGTTALVALKQRKRFIGIEIKQEYIDMSYRRIANVQQRIF